MKFKTVSKLSILFFLIFMGCSNDNQKENIVDNFDLENFNEFSAYLNGQFNLLNNPKNSRNETAELTIDGYKEDVKKIILNEDEQLIADFNLTFDYYYNNYQFIEDSNPEFQFTALQQNEMDDLSLSIEESLDIDDAIQKLDSKYSEIFNSTMSDYDKEVLLLNTLIFKEYFILVKVHPELISAPFQGGRNQISGRGWWDCFRRTAGKKIARGMVYGAVTGAISGAKIGAAGGTVALPGIGTATGAVGGAVFGAATGAITGAVGGAIWAAADCF